MVLTLLVKYSMRAESYLTDACEKVSREDKALWTSSRNISGFLEQVYGLGIDSIPWSITFLPHGSLVGLGDLVT